MGRLLFAISVTLVFLTSLLASFVWALVVMTTIVVAMAAWLLSNAAQREERAEMVSWVLSPFLGTNNRWWAWVFVMVVVSTILFLRTPPGDTPFSWAARTFQNATSAASDTRERFHNLVIEGRFATDEELNPKIAEESFTQRWFGWIFTQDQPQPRSWRTWATRLFMTMLLWLLWLGYTPFAFRDEMVRAYQKAEAVWMERAEGTTAEPMLRVFLRRMLHMPAHPPRHTPPGPRPAGEAVSFGRIFWGSMWAETIGTIITRLIHP